jgi:hypothetical protein
MKIFFLNGAIVFLIRCTSNSSSSINKIEIIFLSIISIFVNPELVLKEIYHSLPKARLQSVADCNPSEQK